MFSNKYISSILLSTLIFISSAGIALDSHYCKGDLKRISIFKKALSCVEMAAQAKSCCATKNSCKAEIISCGINGEHEGCCENKLIILEQDIDVNVHHVQSEKTTSKIPIASQEYSAEKKSQITYSQIIIPSFKGPPKIISGPQIRIHFQSFSC